MSQRHPSDANLMRWLNTGSPSRVERHVAGCERCQRELERLSELDAGMIQDLGQVAQVPDDLAARTHEGVDSRLNDHAALGAFAELFTLGWGVVQTLLDPLGDPPQPQRDTPDADGVSEGMSS